MQYVLTGFTHHMGLRVFAFECIAKDRSRTEYKVSADLDLIRSYGIRVQDLPLLCLGVLEQRDESGEQRTFTYSESDMRRNADLRAAQAAVAQKRNVHRRPPSANVGAAWRAPNA